MMKILVLGGCGIQGRTAVYDLSRDPAVGEIICADRDLASGMAKLEKIMDLLKVRPVKMDVSDSDQLHRLFSESDVAIDLLPRQCTEPVCDAALKTGISVVNTNYGYPIAHLDAQARERGIAIMPECGLDPGIDLVIYGDASKRFDEIHLLNSYCGGFPEASACDNPLKYKISWVWEGVLVSTKRASRIIADGQVVDIPPEDQHDEKWVHSIDFPGLGTLEAIPNGDAVFFTDLIEITSGIRDTGRYSLRWPGWSAFWRPLKALGFLDDEPVAGLPGDVSPLAFMDRHLAPKLQYGRDEKDLVAMINIFEGIKNGEHVRLTVRMLIERDLETGLMAMSKGVGFPAAIVARMIARGEITQKGVLRPIRDIPYDAFMKELTARGIHVTETEEVL